MAFRSSKKLRSRPMFPHCERTFQTKQVIFTRRDAHYGAFLRSGLAVAHSRKKRRYRRKIRDFPTSKNLKRAAFRLPHLEERWDRHAAGCRSTSRASSLRGETQDRLWQPVSPPSRAHCPCTAIGPRRPHKPRLTSLCVSRCSSGAGVSGQLCPSRMLKPCPFTTNLVQNLECCAAAQSLQPRFAVAGLGRPWRGDKVPGGRVDGGGLQPAAVCSYW